MTSRQNLIFNNFIGGEVGPRFYMRVESDKYKGGVKTLQNLKIQPQGGAISREGTVFVAEAKDHTKKCRLIEFEFSTEDAYVIELGNLYARFYKNNAQIQEADKTITGITQANPAVVTSTAHGYSNGDQVVLSEINGMLELNNRRFVVANKTATTFELTGEDSTGYDAYVSGGVANKPYEIVTEYLEAELFDIDITQSADILYLVHSNHEPVEITRASDTSWTIAESVFIDGPYLTENVTTTTLAPSAPSGTSKTIAASSVTGINDGQGFISTDVGRFINLNHDGDLGYAEITAINSTTNVDVDIKNAFSSANAITAITQANPAQVTSAAHGFFNGDIIYIEDVVGMTEVNDLSFTVGNATTNTFTIGVNSTAYTAYTSGGNAFNISPVTAWKLGAWSNTTKFPETTTIYEQRLFFGGNSTLPDTVWGSKVSSFLDFTPGTADSDAIEYTIASGKVDRIRWLNSHQTLRIGTNGSENTLTGSDNSASLSPTNIKGKRETTHGSAKIDALSVGNNTLFWQRAGKKLYELNYSFEANGLRATNISIIGHHLAEPGITQMAYQSEPDGIVWCTRNDGVLLGLTYLRSENVVAWHKHDIGGPAGTKVESVASIPASNQDQVWVSVKRTINGSTKRYIERLGDNFFDDPDNRVQDAVFVDSSLSFTGTQLAATLTPGATTGDGVTFTAGSAVFVAGDVGRHIRTSTTDADGNISYAKAIITQYNSTTEVLANIVDDFASTSAISSGDWTISALVVTGLGHLEGETVTLLADGGVHPDVVVTDGAITLERQSTDVHIGYSYDQVLETLDLEGANQFGSGQGSKARITDVILRLYKSVGFSVGNQEDDLELIEFRLPNDPMDEGTPLFTGDKDIRPRHGWRDSAKLFIKQTQPLPLNVLGYVAKVESNTEK